MIVGVPSETYPGERRVAAVPQSVKSLTEAGLEVVVQTGAGQQAGFRDEAYEERGARIAADRDAVFAEAECLLQVRTLGANPEAGQDDLERLRAGQIVIGMAEPLAEPDAAQSLAKTEVTSFGMELLPRITRAQSMDVLSSQATVAGYKAVLLAAEALPRMFPLFMTAAGTVHAARAFVVGAGVAGLQAIATARRLGAVVQAYDVRPAVKEQVESLGAKFVEMELETEESEDKAGYAKDLGEEFYRRQRALMAEILIGSDVVITTAAVPGKEAPVLLTGEMVAGMPLGSVVVDLAAERGGNCELTRAGETVVEHGVTILGPVNLAATVPYHASQMYARNLTTFLMNMVSDGQLKLDTDDPIVQETLMTRDGEVVHARLRELLGLDPGERSES